MKSCGSSTLRSSLVVVVLVLLSFLVVCIVSKLLFVFTVFAGKEISKSEVDDCELKILKECVCDSKRIALKVLALSLTLVISL